MHKRRTVLNIGGGGKVQKIEGRGWGKGGPYFSLAVN